MPTKRKSNPDQGDVVLVEFPGAQLTKRRPAVVLSSAQYHAERPDAIVGLITSQLVHARTATDHKLEDWKQVGLSKPSAYRTFVATLPRSASIALSEDSQTEIGSRFLNLEIAFLKNSS